MSTLKILKASAGSGKTHDLTQQYIDFVLPPDDKPFDRYAFRHILAVTFTNKATEEMKSRIVDEIDAISKSDKVTPVRRERAKKVLTAILHDYSSFSVSTIDKFFQGVMRAFAREINQYASYKVELDTGSVLHQAVDGMMASLDDPANADLLQWLTKYSISRIEASEKWDVSDELFRMASLFMREDFKLKKRRRGVNWDKSTLRELRSSLEALCNDKEIDKQTCLTAKLVNDNVYLLGIFSDLYANLQSYLVENNLVLLSETADVLNRIIDGSDTPFIYEKIGTRFDHFMLDEFQDTSRLQWENFRPLIAEALDRGEDSLIVGDIKQSIYRWRNSDLRLLDSDVYKDFRSEQLSTMPKLDNWRSYENIVIFNNSFFSSIASLAADEDPSGRIARFYGDACQKVPQLREDHTGKGYVRVSFLPRKDEDDETYTWREMALDRLGDDIEALLKIQRPCDITVLVRKNTEGEQVASRLLALGYEVITEDSLMLSISSSVRKLIAVLKYITNPEDSINAVTMRMLFNTEKPDIEGLDINGSLYRLCESILREKISPLPEGETPFVYAFLDEVLGYMDKFGSNLRGFIQWWDETGFKKCISAPQSDNAIRVMTIHKAKGLAAKSVILPFFNEVLHNNNLPNYIWCEPDVEPFKSASLVPMKCTSELKDSIFAGDFDEETLMQVVDSINTAYVAMTRAVCNMIIYCPLPKFKKGGISKSYFGVSDYLYRHLEKDLDAENSWEVGQICSDKADKPSESTFVCRDFISKSFDDRLKLSLRGGDYFDRDQGIRYHDVLSRIDFADDLEKAMDEAVAEGMIGERDIPAVRAKMNAVFEKCAPLHWFDGTWHGLNETSIVDELGNVSRPDRVLVEKDKPLGKGKAIVIDYKFGARRQSYRSQVEGYMNRLREMGYTDVTGAILYCKDEIEIDNI